MPGVKVFSVIGEHAIMIDEFKQIDFFEYQGIDLLRMSHEKQTERKIFHPSIRNMWHILEYNRTKPHIYN